MDHEIVIIGGGLTGIGVGAALVRAGLTDFAILERAHDFGGTWRDNRYPGVGVDVPTFGYQFSYETNPNWSRVFAKGHEMKTYIDDFVVKYGLESYARFGTEALGRTWDDDAKLWRIETRGGGEITARFVVSAVGAYIEKRPVAVPGYADFTGKILQPTDWDYDYDLRGKRVAVIGTGATSVQIVPSIAPYVEHLDVYQRTATWIIPKIDPEIPAWLTAMFRRSPLLRRLMYEAALWGTELTLLSAINRYTTYPWIQKAVEAFCRWHMRRTLKNPELSRRLMPDYPFGSKRGCMTNDYLQAYSRDNVELVTDPIECFTANGIRTRAGVERFIDAVVPAVGYRMAFDPAAYVETPVHGRNGFELGHHFATQKLKAYQGISMPNLPNYFMVFSAYSTVGGTWQPMVEIAGNHIVRVVEECHRRGAVAAEITSSALERDHAPIERLMRRSLFLNRDCSSANTYYVDQHGDAPILRPVTVGRARRESLTFPLNDYQYTRAAALADEGARSTADGHSPAIPLAARGTSNVRQSESA
jgi:cation diffusion facilitator CzcD-associated flavoprotein CzcO